MECIGCESSGDSKEIKNPMNLTEEEWKKRLTPEQFYICREKGTEPSGSGMYLNHWKKGVYACVACGQELFKSETKYDACGWPSFWDAIPGSVRVESDLEAVCTRCGSHLGHRFDDGPKPTGKRY